MEILSNSQLSDIITWLPNGKGFIILQKRKFATEVMPMYFKHSKFTSFTRKLNRWGFTRVTRGPESGAYYHKVRLRCIRVLFFSMISVMTWIQTDQSCIISYPVFSTRTI